MIKKFIQIFIFAGYWLCFVPWLVLILNRQNIINPYSITDYFIQYTTLLFLLIVVYWLLNIIVDHYYTNYEIRKKVRKITIKQQLERLRRGEMDIEEAQDMATFTRLNKPKSPKAKRSAKKPKPQEMQALAAKKAKSIENLSKDISPNKAQSEGLKPKAPAVPDNSGLPAYSDEMCLLET